MSTLFEPVGPQSRAVYWVRRGVVVLVVLALVVGIRALLTRGGGSDTAAPTPSTSSSSPAPDPSASGTVSSSPTAKPTTSGSAGSGACKESQISVTASTDAATYTVGATPRLRMRIQNISDTSCKRDIGSASNELVISSGTARVWSSDDCNTGGTPQVVTLKPQQSYSVSVTWLGRVSKKGCPPDQPIAEAGSYKLVGRNGDVASDPAVFSLTAAS